VRHSFDEAVGRTRSGTIGEPPSMYSPPIPRKLRSNSQGDATQPPIPAPTPTRTQRLLRNCIFNLYPLVAAPFVEADYGSILR
jgi:hypothetical protein